MPGLVRSPRAVAYVPVGVGGAQGQPGQPLAGLEGPSHLPDPLQSLVGKADRHGEVPAQWKGDVLAVHDDVEQGVAGVQQSRGALFSTIADPACGIGTQLLGMAPAAAFQVVDRIPHLLSDEDVSRAFPDPFLQSRT